MGTTQLREHVLSPAVAHELLYTGELRKGADFAHASGINHILPKQDVQAKAVDIARRIAEKPRLAIEALKRTLSLPRRRAFEETITLESLMHQITFRALDAQRRIEGDDVE
jgi:polyketide biosynthesis enoyl-CoA hydratase PksI